MAEEGEVVLCRHDVRIVRIFPHPRIPLGWLPRDPIGLYLADGIAQVDGQAYPPAGHFGPREHPLCELDGVAVLCFHVDVHRVDRQLTGLACRIDGHVQHQPAVLAVGERHAHPVELPEYHAEPFFRCLVTAYIEVSLRAHSSSFSSSLVLLLKYSVSPTFFCIFLSIIFSSPTSPVRSQYRQSYSWPVRNVRWPDWMRSA